VDADQPLKTLFRARTREILGLLGERGARVVSARVIELPASRRTVDVVLRLRRGRESYVRHVEFEMRYRRGLELRLFEYAARLEAQFRLPVATTVVFLRPPAPRRLSHRHQLRGRLVNEWRFDVLRLWDYDPEKLLAMGPGPAALVGRARSSGIEHVRAAVRLISHRTAPPERDDLLYVLQVLCGGRYTAEELERMIPREAAMGSGMFAKEFRQARAEGKAEGKAEGRAEGRAEGQAEGLRATCLDIVGRFHPALVGRLTPVIEACRDSHELRQWTLAATRLPASDFVQLIMGVQLRSTASRARRAPRPARRAAARKR
jgi:predicted transposase YdaD